MPLSDNEKAAMFIEWKPGRQCNYSTDFVATGDEKYYCSRCQFWQSRGDHHIPAPDMSDPRNYMKALQSLETQTILLLREGGRWHLQLLLRSIDSRHFKGPERTVCSTAIVEALAALYDAEHPKPDHGSV